MRSEIPTAISSAAGLLPEDRWTVYSLLQLYRKKLARNNLRNFYYLMHARPRELGISVPPNLRKLEQAMGWPAKAVNALANRSQFDGFVCADERADAELQALVAGNRLKQCYHKAVKSELVHSCAFLAVTAGDASRGEPSALVRAYPATAAAALYSDRAARISAGMVVVDRDRSAGGGDEPTWVDVYTDSAVISIKRRGHRGWAATYAEHGMGRCLMEPLAHEATLDRPFGSSRITRAVMDITDDAMRASVRAEVASEFMTSPQKFLMGADADVLDGMSKWDAYIGNIFAVSKDADGDVPQFGQLPQGSMQPHIDYMRSLAVRFSGETDIPVSELGVVSDNPSSSEAIYAAKEPLVVSAQNLNIANGDALVNVALMALAVEHGTDYATEARAGLGVQARFRNPAMPSIVSQSDAMVKMIAALPWLAESDVALEEFGFTDDQIQRLRPVRTRALSRPIVQQAAMSSGLALGAADD